jgi:hypothetical protein
MILASWGLVVLSAPILAALGRMFDAGFTFYLINMPALLCLVTISANVSTWLLLAIVRWARRWWWYPVGALAIFAMGTAAHRMWFSDEAGLTPGDIAGNVNQILRHTQICTHPLLPSSWVSEAILASGRPTFERSLFFNGLLLSNAMVCLLVTAVLSGRWFYPAWHRMMASSFTPRESVRIPTPRGQRASERPKASFTSLLGPRSSISSSDSKRHPLFHSGTRPVGAECVDFWSAILLHLESSAAGIRPRRPDLERCDQSPQCPRLQPVSIDFDDSVHFPSIQSGRSTTLDSRDVPPAPQPTADVKASPQWNRDVIRDHGSDLNIQPHHFSALATSPFLPQRNDHD